MLQPVKVGERLASHLAVSLEGIMAIPRYQFNHMDAKCIYQNLAHLMTQPGRTCPFGQDACNAWHSFHFDNEDHTRMKQWIEQFLTHDQWEMLQHYCASSPGKNGKLLDSLETSSKNQVGYT